MRGVPAGAAVLDQLPLLLGPGEVRGLLGCCMELLRPESGCTGEVRLQALAVMQAAVSQFLSSLQQEEADEHAQLKKLRAQKGSSGKVESAMARVAEEAAERDRRHAALWSDYGVEVLLYSVMHDPSIKVRRGGLRLLTTIALAQDSSTANQLVQVLLSKMRDRDGLVRDAALDMLLQLPASLLTSCQCSEAEWLWLMSQALQRCTAAQVGLSRL
ncbi:hypothetical protein QJQ45_013472 [Haematococcus lacustris]|nr:hypothetical protein QJQ45_013472 [Haematococcus lacustris]